jgi:hypothetical protein
MIFNIWDIIYLPSFLCDQPNAIYNLETKDAIMCCLVRDITSHGAVTDDYRPMVE